jgi:hypothetical protein
MKHGPWQYKDVRPGGCLAWPGVMAVAIASADAYLKDKAKKKGTGEFACPRDMRCCNKKGYKGQYELTLDVQVTAHHGGRPACKITGKISATLTVEGEVGECR